MSAASKYAQSPGPCSPLKDTPAKWVRCKRSTVRPRVSQALRICRFRPSLSSKRSVRGPSRSTRHGNVRTTRRVRCVRPAFFAWCSESWTTMSTPALKASMSFAVASFRNSTRYTLGRPAAGRSSASGTRPSFVTSTSPVEALSRRPTVKTRGASGPSALPSSLTTDFATRVSAVHSKPSGFQYLRYRSVGAAADAEDHDDGPASTLASSKRSQSCRTPSSATTAPGPSRAPGFVTRAPSTVTRPSQIAASAWRRDRPGMHLLSRMPPGKNK
mmetsp:Transcript_22345/g.88712  ORF Transcript_22345/g.88712 Transcript_22345/m.88712 type:complete len:272 (+) Transcript_22345:120-935(+)